MRHLLSIKDLDTDSLSHLVEKGMAIIRDEWKDYRPLQGKIVGIYFRKPSTRTRSSFTVGALHLGAAPVVYGPNDLQLSTGETIQDTARVLGSYLDVLVARTNDSDQEMREMAEQTEMPIINAMSEDEHPTQVIGDLITLKEAFGRLDGLHILYLGEGNNTAASLCLAVGMTPGMRLTLMTPKGFGIKPRILEDAKAEAAKRGSRVDEFHDMSFLPTGVDAVYTTRWETMGVKHEEANWRDHFRPYQVNAALMAKVSKSDTIFLHDLPAIRGADVTDEVLDGPQSLAFRQARHKLTSAMAVLEWCTRA